MGHCKTSLNIHNRKTGLVAAPVVTAVGSPFVPGASKKRLHSAGGEGAVHALGVGEGAAEGVGVGLLEVSRNLLLHVRR